MEWEMGKDCGGRLPVHALRVVDTRTFSLVGQAPRALSLDVGLGDHIKSQPPRHTLFVNHHDEIRQSTCVTGCLRQPND